ncbi:conserved hypothetical protein [Nitrobacter hamburgensis X14]|uniref:DUF2336 domain-containing protein n=1 Tax=Nitrobacter hamburgensis (strain DSM 10229 / NCIMB 13809 / X14) TaxID=323097 RepID=Q1QNH6_NITHX|nr:DUF2336 domain-containing protein [Nitrobacter hamburgensis]ABE62221.1 conserved hypothetical protein [Nitrobacter hamburgensis X14]
MIAPPMFPGFDGLLTLSRRDGVDIRPTLLRVLTDLYVQTSTHSAEEEQHFVELTTRLIDQVDDATRAAVRARLSIYPRTPAAIMSKLRLHPAAAHPRAPIAPPSPHAPPAAEAKPRTIATLAMEPRDAAEISEMFFSANARDRALILHNLATAPLRPSPHIHPSRAARAIETLHMAAFAADVDNFTTELGETLILPARVAERVVKDPGGEPLACAAKAVGMSSRIFQQVLLFLDPAIGTSVVAVYRLSRLYDQLNERSARIMLAAWRGATMTEARAKYRPTLYDDERHRVRTAPAHTRPGVAQPGAAAFRRGTGRDGSDG